MNTSGQNTKQDIKNHEDTRMLELVLAKSCHIFALKDEISRMRLCDYTTSETNFSLPNTFHLFLQMIEQVQNCHSH